MDDGFIYGSAAPFLYFNRILFLVNCCLAHNCSHGHSHHNEQNDTQYHLNRQENQKCLKVIGFALFLLTAESPDKRHNNICTGNHHNQKRNHPFAHRHRLFQFILRLLILILQLLLNCRLRYLLIILILILILIVIHFIHDPILLITYLYLHDFAIV